MSRVKLVEFPFTLQHHIYKPSVFICSGVTTINSFQSVLRHKSVPAPEAATDETAITPRQRRINPTETIRLPSVRQIKQAAGLLP